MLLPLLLVACTNTTTRSEVAASLEGIQPGEERAIGDATMEMHRMQAMAPLGDGWHRASSTKGGFSVELPLPFNDFRIRALATDGVGIHTDALGGKTPGLLSWMASCITRADGTAGPESPEPGDTTGLVGDPPKAHQRTVVTEDRTCVLIVEAQGSDPLPDEATRLRFLRSLQLGAE